jgi:RNA polymerase sigma-70 factor (ECF subfamily)
VDPETPPFQHEAQEAPPSHTDHERDLALLLQLREGNEQAFNTIVALYLEPLYRFAYIRTQDSQLADDIAQDVLVQLWEHREQLNPAGSLKGYLFRSVRNRTLNSLRHEQSLQRVAQVFTTDRTLHSPQPSADTTIELEEGTRLLRIALASLPPRTREIFLLRREQEMSYAEIAETFGISVATVHNQMSRAVNAIRRALERWQSGGE